MFCHLMVLSLALVSSAQWNNYCHQICGNKSTHTLCKFPRAGPGARCAGYLRARLSPDEKKRIVARLNRRRNQAAQGELLDLPTASNMMKLRWVDDLAVSAQRWADQCVPPATPEIRDECRDLYISTTGQTVASIVGESPGLRVEALVDSWYMQSMLFRGNVTSYQPSQYDKSYYGDFTQMLWARSYMVGCGRSSFMTMQGARHTGVVRLVCNFAPRGNLRARPVWMPGAPCARCPADTACYNDLPALCHYQNISITDENQRAINETKFMHGLLNTVLEDYNSTGNTDTLFDVDDNVETPEITKKDTDLEHIEYATANTNVTLGPLGFLKEDLAMLPGRLENEEKYNRQFRRKKILLKNATSFGRPKAYELEDLIYKQTVKLNPNSYFSYRRAGNFDDDNFDVDASAGDANLYENENTNIQTEDNETQNGRHYDAHSPGDEDSEMSVAARQNVLKSLLDMIENNDEDLVKSMQDKSDFSKLSEFESTTETKEDLIVAVERAQYEHAIQPTHIKVRRELREQALEAAETTVPPPTTVSLPPLLKKLVNYFPFLSYETMTNGAGKIVRCNLEIVCVVIMSLLVN